MDALLDVLLVEDNLSDAKLTMMALKKLSPVSSIFHVIDGEEAIDFLYAKGKYSDRNICNKPKLILLDIKMPKLNGFQVLKILKKEDKFKNIPVVILSSSKEDQDINEGYNLGVNSYIVKPIDFNEYMNYISTVGYYWIKINEV